MIHPRVDPRSFAPGILHKIALQQYNPPGPVFMAAQNRLHAVGKQSSLGSDNILQHICPPVSCVLFCMYALYIMTGHPATGISNGCPLQAAVCGTFKGIIQFFPSGSH